MKWAGLIGYGKTAEAKPGVWQDVITERYYFGDILENNRLAQTAGQVNDNININNTFSIVADSYATQHIGEMRYLTYGGTKWKITNVKVMYPRLQLSVGGVYNG